MFQTWLPQNVGSQTTVGYPSKCMVELQFLQRNIYAALHIKQAGRQSAR